MYLGSVDDAVEQRGQCPVAGAHVGLHAECHGPCSYYNYSDAPTGRDYVYYGRWAQHQEGSPSLQAQPTLPVSNSAYISKPRDRRWVSKN